MKKELIGDVVFDIRNTTNGETFLVDENGKISKQERDGFESVIQNVEIEVSIDSVLVARLDVSYFNMIECSTHWNPYEVFDEDDDEIAHLAESINLYKWEESLDFYEFGMDSEIDGFLYVKELKVTDALEDITVLKNLFKTIRDISSNYFNDVISAVFVHEDALKTEEDKSPSSINSKLRKFGLKKIIKTDIFYL